LNTDLSARWLGRPHHGRGALQLAGPRLRTAPGAFELACRAICIGPQLG